MYSDRHKLLEVYRYFDRIDRLWRLKKAIFWKIGSLNCHAYLLEKLQKKDDHVDFTSTYILSIIQTNVRI